jgi:3'(2'), 5'-bisphosphate nucleotidase
MKKALVLIDLATGTAYWEKMMADIFKQNGITANQRGKFLGQRGAVIWLTGLSGSGKSTIAYSAEKMLLESKIFTAVLDGDNLRFGLNADLGFSDADRAENIRRISHVSTLFAQSGGIAIVSAISPFAADRDTARAVSFAGGVPFVEVFIDTPLQECVRRDVKGLYKKAMNGEIDNFTGISSPYEVPENPEMIIRTDECSAQAAAQMIFDYVKMLFSLEQMTRAAAGIAIAAGKKILEIYNGDFAVDYKDDRSPLTAADLAANTVICDYLAEQYGQYAILSEESKDTLERRANPGCFVVDPLDGTKEFVKRNGEFTVNIAFAYHGKSVMGVVYAPVLDKLWYAAEGLGAFCQPGSEDGYFAEQNRIHVTDKKDNLTVMASRSHAGAEHNALLEKNKAKIGETISIGSSLKGCLIAEGKADVYYRTGLTCEWDTAAMQCVVEQAGGVFLQGDGTPMRYNRENTLNEKGFFILNNIGNRFD